MSEKKQKITQSDTLIIAARLVKKMDRELRDFDASYGEKEMIIKLLSHSNSSRFNR